jgi:hypothetical protein
MIFEADNLKLNIQNNAYGCIIPKSRARRNLANANINDFNNFAPVEESNNTVNRVVKMQKLFNASYPFPKSNLQFKPFLHLEDSPFLRRR